MDVLSHSKRRRPLAALLWAVLLLSTQALAVSHQHFDGTADSPCAVCPLAKAQTAACDTPALPTATAAAYMHPQTPEAPPAAAAPPAPFQPRAPPNS